MIRFERVVTTSHASWDFFVECYLQSFPSSERREIADLEAMLKNNDFYCCLIFLDKNPVGILTTWQLDGFAYVEHFAIDKMRRGEQLGGRALNLFLESQIVPVILEVEPPDDEMSCRRIGFYERLGFKLCRLHYIQPAYSSFKRSVELCLMEWNGRLLEQHFEGVKRELYSKVYGVKISE